MTNSKSRNKKKKRKLKRRAEEDSSIKKKRNGPIRVEEEEIEYMCSCPEGTVICTCQFDGDNND